MKSTLAIFALAGLALLASGSTSTTANAQYYRCDPYGVDGPPCPRVRVHPPLILSGDQANSALAIIDAVLGRFEAE